MTETPGKTETGLPTNQGRNVGVGPRRTTVLRKAYLAGTLGYYLDAIRAAGPKRVAPPAAPYRSKRDLPRGKRPMYAGAAAVRRLRLLRGLVPRYN